MAEACVYHDDFDGALYHGFVADMIHTTANLRNWNLHYLTMHTICSNISRVYVTCLDNGDSTYRDCREHPGRHPNLPNKPNDPFTPTPDRPLGGIFKIPTPRPAAQDTSQSGTNGTQQQGGIIQGDPVVGGETPTQDSPQSEISEPRQGGILGNWGLLKTSQDQERTSQEGVTAEPPAIEETQPAIVNEEPVPPCPDGQVLDEESSLYVLEEPRGDEQSEEENQE